MLYNACATGVDTPCCQACDLNIEGTLDHRHRESSEYGAIRNEMLSVDNEQRLRRQEGGDMMVAR